MVLRLFSAVLLLAAAALLAVWRGWLAVPPEWNPWAPLDVRLAPNLLTPFKLLQLQRDRSLCGQALATSGLEYAAVPDSTPDDGCTLENIVQIRGSRSVTFSSRFLATCRLAVGLALFERHYLQPAAQRIFGERVKRIEHYGSFACRNIYHRQDGPLSEHARANALDVAGFTLQDGRHIPVAGHWNAGNDDARFLHEVRDGACEVFNTTLGPDYNAAHANHLHLDMGHAHICR